MPFHRLDVDDWTTRDGPVGSPISDRARKLKRVGDGRVLFYTTEAPNGTGRLSQDRGETWEDIEPPEGFPGCIDFDRRNGVGWGAFYDLGADQCCIARQAPGDPWVVVDTFAVGEMITSLSISPVYYKMAVVYTDGASYFLRVTFDDGATFVSKTILLTASDPLGNTDIPLLHWVGQTRVVVTTPAGGGGDGGVMMGFVTFDGATPTAYFLKYQGGAWTLLSTHSSPGVADGADGGSPATASYGIKTPAGSYILSLDMFADTYPYFTFISTDGVTWEAIFEDIDAVDDAVTQTLDGAIWGFKVDGIGPSSFKVYRDGALKYTAPGADNVYTLQHIAAHENMIAVAGYHFINGPGFDDDVIPWVVASVDGDSWNSVELPDTLMSVSSFEHLNLAFLSSGRLVYLTMHETPGILGDTGPDGLRIWYADPPFTSWTMVNESGLWDRSGDEDWEGGPLTGGLHGSTKLFFVGHSTLGPVDEPRVFMSEDQAESWVELPQPPSKVSGICYDDVEDAVYLLMDEPVGTYVLRMQPPSTSGDWVDISAGMPVSPEFPYTSQAIWKI